MRSGSLPDADLKCRERDEQRAAAGARDAAREAPRLDDEHVASQMIEHPLGGVAEGEALETRA